MRRKVILQMLVVLILGFFIGFLTHSGIVSNKIKNYSWRHGEVTFWTHALDEIEATPEQRKQIMPIVISYSEKGHLLVRDAMKKVEPLWEEMEKEIAPHLSPVQARHLDELKLKRIEKFRDRTRTGPRGRGDGPHDGRRDERGERPNGSPDLPKKVQ